MRTLNIKYVLDGLTRDTLPIRNLLYPNTEMLLDGDCKKMDNVIFGNKGGTDVDYQTPEPEEKAVKNTSVKSKNNYNMLDKTFLF